MGNILGSFYDNNDNNDKETNANFNANTLNYNLKNMNRTELLNFVKQLNPKKLNIQNLGNVSKNIKLCSNDLPSLTVEYYTKLSKVLNEYEYEKTYKHTVYDVQPKFTKEDFENYHRDLISQCENYNKLEIIDFEFAELNDICDMTTNPINLDEFNECFKAFEKNKSDILGINKAILKASPDFIKKKFINCFNDYLDGTLFPNDINFAKSFFKYKKDDPKNVKSFRQLTTISCTVNHLHRIFAKRISNHISQNNLFDNVTQKGGFDCCQPQILKVKNIIQDANKNNKSLCVMFMDISNAFGSVDRNAMYCIMEKYKIDKNIINYVKSFYDSLDFYAKTFTFETDFLRWGENMGILQGCPMSPFLFVLLLDYMFKHIHKKYDKYSYEIGGQKISFTAYMDDVCIVSDNMEKMQEIYNETVLLLEKLGMKVNRQKCAIMKINIDENSNLNIDDIETVNVYKYLGEYISSDGTSTYAFDKTMELLKEKCDCIDNYFLTGENKTKIFNRAIKPWLSRTLVNMYDINNNKRYELTQLLSRYFLRWNSDNPNAEIYINIMDIVNNSNDDIIKNMDFESHLSDNYLKDIYLTNSLLKDKEEIKKAVKSGGYTNAKTQYSFADSEKLIHKLLQIDS